MIRKECLCLVLFLFFLGCEAELPTSPKAGLPVIKYFYAIPSQIEVGGNSTLSWRVDVEGLALNQTLRVFLRWGYIMSTEVERTGTLKMYPTVTTVYTLYAVMNGNTAGEEVLISVGS